MPASTNVNNRTVVHATSGGVCMGMPDVCKTPTPGGPVPIPYPNVAKSQDTAMGSSTVTVDGQPIMLKGSCFSQSTGDEAGSAGGVLSSIIKGKAEFINYPFDVMVEGKNVCRLGDMMLLNNRNTPALLELPHPASAAKRKCGQNTASGPTWCRTSHGSLRIKWSGYQQARNQGRVCRPASPGLALERDLLKGYLSAQLNRAYQGDGRIVAGRG